MMLRKEGASSANGTDRHARMRRPHARAAAVSLFERRRGRHLQWLGGFGSAAGAVLQSPHARDEMRRKSPAVKPRDAALSLIQ